MGGIVCKKIENHTDKSNKNLIISQSSLDHNHEENNGNRPPLHPNTSNLQTVNHLCLDQLSPSTPLKELNLLSYGNLLELFFKNYYIDNYIHIIFSDANPNHRT